MDELTVLRKMANAITALVWEGDYRLGYIDVVEHRDQDFVDLIRAWQTWREMSGEPAGDPVEDPDTFED